MHRMEVRPEDCGHTELKHSAPRTQIHLVSPEERCNQRCCFSVLTSVEMHSAKRKLANKLKRSIERRAQDAMIGDSSSHLHSHGKGATLLCTDTHADGTFTTD